MNKADILKNFNEQEKTEVINLYEKYKLSKERDIPLFGNCFYTPNIWRFFQENMQDRFFTITVDGFFNESERRMISFNNIYGSSFPYKVLKVTNKSKFSNATHRDYLGALLSLGIKREKIGDLLVNGDSCYFPVCEEIHQFIIDNLSSIGRSPCIVEVISNEFEVPSFDFKEEVILVQTLRIDSIVAKLSNISRVKAQNMVDEGKVLIDYNIVNSKSAIVEIGSRITIRGHGKFILEEIVGNSKSGKFKVLIKKYT